MKRFINYTANLSVNSNNTYRKPQKRYTLATFLMAIFLLAGGVINEVWAGDVIYHIVNKNGQLLPIYKTVSHNDGDALQIPDELKTPYIQDSDYKYFTTPEAAGAYNIDQTKTNVATTYSENITDVYVGYVYNGYTPEGLPILAKSMDDAPLHHIKIGSDIYYLRANTHYNSNIYSTRTDFDRPAYGDMNGNGDELVALNYAFAFVCENNDPYDIKIVSPYFPEGCLYGSQSGAYTKPGKEDDGNGLYLNSSSGIDDIKRFFFVRSNIGIVICAVIAPDDDEKLTYIYNNNNYNILLQCTELGGSTNQLVAPVTPLALFHVVNSDGKKVVSAYGEITSPQSVPVGLRTPVMDNDQYRYFNTLADAAAYTKNPTEENAEAAITNIKPGATVYIGYNYTNSPKKIDLNGTRWYYIRQNHSGAPNDTTHGYSYRETTIIGNNNIRVWSKYEIEKQISEGTFTRANAMFKFEGNDPYNMVIRNGYRYDDTENKLSYIQLTRYADWAQHVYTSRNDSTKLQLLDIDRENNYYTIAYRNPEYETDNYIGKKDYLLTWYNNAGNLTNPGQVYMSRNDSNNKLWYYSDRYFTKLTFEPVQYATTFHIIDETGREAISYTDMVDADMPLVGYENIPEAIRSAYIEDESISFYSTAIKNGTDADGRTIYYLTKPIDRTPLLEGCDIYVRYTTDHVTEKSLPLNDSDIIDYNIRINGDNYAYENNGTVSTGNTESSDRQYLWDIVGKDPYAVQLQNLSKKNLLTYTTSLSSDTEELTTSNGSSNGTYFILLNGNSENKYELMAATGDDASKTIYNIGYTNGDSNIKLYKNQAEGSDNIQIEFLPAKVATTYHIIDKQNKEVISAQAPEDAFHLRVPDEISTPLVAQYHYWDEEAFDHDGTTFILKTDQTELTSIGGSKDIYVTYDADDISVSTSAEIADGNRAMYKLKYSDDSDVYAYPYVNENKILEVRDNADFEAQTKSSAITRINWGWYFESDTKDPYHLKLQSAAQFEDNEDDKVYLQSNQTGTGFTTNAEAIVGQTSAAATEYMILGTENGSRLVATVSGEQYTVTTIASDDMGNGTMQIEQLVLQPTLILLDRHGWEIMRKPIPASPDDAEKDQMYQEIRPYNSPMVKAYRFYHTGKKQKGYNKYEVSDSITVAGVPYTSGSLTELPPYFTSDNIWVTSKSGIVDKSRIADQYVIYDVRDVYENTYGGAAEESKVNAETFLVYQGASAAMTTDGTTISIIPEETEKNIEAGDVSDISDEYLEKMLWYVKPNFNIDAEMGYKYAGEAGAQPDALSKAETEAAYMANKRNGFDPYNLQIQNKYYQTYFTTNATSAKVGETASMESTYSGDMKVGLSELSSVSGTGQGDVTLNMTNGTFMAVEDENGNMRLMPRFDHSHVVTNFTTLATQTEAAPALDTNDSQTTRFNRLVMYTYIIVDNTGHEALRYKGSVGEDRPQIPEHFRSPMAKDFKFYKNLEKVDDAGISTMANIDFNSTIEPFYGTYKLDNIADKEITGNFTNADIYDDREPIYVRYSYDPDGDTHNLLSNGNWQIVKINGQYIYDNGETKSGTLPDTQNDSYLFKFIYNATTEDPDPYNVTIFNRNNLTSENEDHYAVLSHGTEGLALALTRSCELTYAFLSLENSTTDTNVSHNTEPNFAKNGTFDGNKSQMTFEEATFNSPKYYIITNDGMLALVATSTHKTATEYPLLPEWACSPMLNDDDYTYYANATYNDETKRYNINEKDRTSNLCGLPKDIVYVRYKYNKDTCPLTVANTWVKTDETSVKVSYSPLDLTGSTWYNIEYEWFGGAKQIWFTEDASNDYAMHYVDRDKQERNEQNDFFDIQGQKNYMFTLGGNDPYAIKIYSFLKGDELKFSTASDFPFTKNQNLNAVFAQDNDNKIQTFMLLKKDYTQNNVSRYKLFLAATGYPSIIVKHTGVNSYFYVMNNTENDTEVPDDPYLNLPAEASNGINALTFYKAPTVRYYTFHGIRYNDEGTAPYSLDENGKPKVTWTAKLRRNWLTKIRLEDDMTRLYAQYENDNATNEFSDRTEIEYGRFYADQDLQKPLHDKDSNTYSVYPEIAEDENYDIYFKYKVVSADLDTLTSTKEDIAADVKTHGEDGKLKQSTIQSKWWFMVLDTDENITTNTDADGTRTPVGNQYFLYRKDDGNIGWLDDNNTLHKEDRTLHKEDHDNYNGLSYNRLAESYKQGDNDAFREGRWLWAFIGNDPYNMQVLNMESAVGVTPNGKGIYSLPKGEDCYTIVTEEIVTDTLGNVLSRTYPISIPTEKPTENYLWGLSPGYGTENTFKLVLPITDDNYYTLYWMMMKADTTENKAATDSVAGAMQQTDRSNAIKLLRYEPLSYEDVSITVRRIDEVKEYQDALATEKSTVLANMTTGISKFYFAKSDRMYVAGDVIDLSTPETLPINIRRAFCDYTLFSDAFETEGGIYTVKAGPYPDYSKPQILEQSGDTLRDYDGNIIYKYYNVDSETGKRTTDADRPQSIYASYTVTSDMFLPTAPTKAEVKIMVENNDHVFFMEFPDTVEIAQPTYNTGHHAYYDEHATFRDQVGDLTKKIDSNRGQYIPEKRKWNGTKFVDDIETLYNQCQFKTTSNRMETIPQNLKWYFVGDPYKVQVYCTAGQWGSNNDTENPKDVAANLCRFDETETNFQFVVDCVHLRVPDYSNLDEREYVTPTDEYGNALDPVPNKGYRKPYFDDFYWEVVPAASKDSEAFALRFKEDNDLLGYRNVYYYLAHDGVKKEYRDTGENTSYNINLSYNADNKLQTSGDYTGYHDANNKNTVIKLVKPVKVYMSAYKNNNYNTRITQDELSEYYGYGETLTEVPRHLQRKYVSYYNDIRFTTASGTSNAYFTNNKTEVKLSDDNIYSSETCVSHQYGYVSTDEPTVCNRVFKFDVKYQLNDYSDDKKTIKIFTSEDNYKNNNIQWLDMSVGGNWLYYDKIDGTNDKISNYKNAVAHNDASGWKDGLKGLHWAFIGDPYDFKIVNRRKDVDEDQVKLMAGEKITINNFNGENDSVIWTTKLIDYNSDPQTDHSSDATAAADINTHWSLQTWKTGGDSDYFLRTASLKSIANDYNSSFDAPYINQTNNYWRMVSKQYSESTPESYFEMVPYSLSDRSSYNNDKYSSNYTETMNGLGVTQQKLEVRTVTAADDDGAKNDCFDATIRVVSEAGVERILKKGFEVRYLDYKEYEDKKDHGDPVVLMPTTLKRYGCTYECYVNYVDASNRGTRIEDFNSDEFKTTYVKNSGEPVTLTYVYKVTDAASQFFTSQENAAMEEFIWLFAYYMWQQSFSGTNVEVEITEKVFDHYVYNSEGKVIDEVYKEVKRTEIVQNPSDPFDLSSYLNSHSQQSSIYGDESSQSDDDRLKWCLVGDPYSFTMTNYAQYLENVNSALTSNGNNIVASNLESAQFTIIIAEDGKAYLAIIDPETGDYNLITFDNSATSDKSLTIVKGAGINDNDPTGNSININNVKEFFLTGLLNYANLVTYHLVMAHQYSLNEYKDTDTDLTTEQKEDVKNRLLEFLKYWSLYTSDVKDRYLDYDENGKLIGYKPELETVIKNLLRRNGTLRDLINDTIPDAEVSQVGIGIRPAVPWYMRRQYCTYTMYQRDVQQAITDYNSPAYEIADQEWKDNGGKTAPIDGIEYKVDESGERIPKTYVDENGELQQVYNVKWVSIFNVSEWIDWTENDGEKSKYEVTDEDVKKWGNKDKELKAGTLKTYPSGYARVKELQDNVITRLDSCHRDRHVIIDLLYDVSSNQFRFAADGRNSTAWYQMQNQGNDGALMNFSYTNGIGTNTDPAHHYTNDYLWAPEGDPYGFVLRSRYATNNGTGWDNVAVTTTNALPKNKEDNTEVEDENNVEDENVTYTSIKDNLVYDRKQIVQKQNAAKNAVYEMFVGNYLHPDAFVMHPTSAWLDTDNTNTPSFYVVYSPGTTNADDIGDTDDTDVPAIKLTYGSLADIKNNPNANWKLTVTAEQLLPYFDRSGYVGGLEPAKAQSFTNMDIRNQLRSSISNGTQPDFKLLSQAQEVVYSGTFKYKDGTEVAEGEEPTNLPLTFQATNLVNMNKGYYRIKAFSEDALNNIEESHEGVVGPRYISGYRFESEKESKKESKKKPALNLHLFETSMDSTTIHTFGELFSNSTHAPLQENIELLPADFDPSSIFQFTKEKKENDGLYSLHTQELAVGVSDEDEDKRTNMSETGTNFFIEDIGGTAVTIRTRSKDDISTLTDIEDDLKSMSYLNVDKDERYDVTYGKSEELEETSYGVQTTKWLLQPVGIKEAWPYNEMPLRVEVQKGGVSARDNNTEDKYYYGSLYVPFDTRMGRTTDGAFTMVSDFNSSNKDAGLTLPSVSQHNGIGNPQYVPAGWPVLLRTDKPQTTKYKKDDSQFSKYYVDMYLPYDEPKTVKANIKLEGSYLERELTDEEVDLNKQTVMVFGLPYIENSHDIENSHAYNKEKSPVGLYTNDNWWREKYPEATTTTATDGKRNNKYVYHNKVYYILDDAPYNKHSSVEGNDARQIPFIVTIFDDGDAEQSEQEEGSEDTEYFNSEDTATYPCDVYDLQGRRVARNETPETLRHNHPGLPKGVYIFGNKKVVVK